MTARDYEIRLEGVRAFGRHGVLASERRGGQEFVVDARLSLTREPSDDLATTVDYAALAEALVADVARDPVDLLETLADRLLATCLARPGVRAATVTVHKPAAPIPVPFADVSVTVGGAAVRRAVLSLGANLGDREATLRDAVGRLAALEGVRVTAVSPVYETAPVGGVPQPDYLNLVVLADVALAPETLLARTQAIEAELGRVRDVRWGPRTLDIDLVACGEERRDGPALTLPHPRAHERAFVLVPWSDADPDAVLPDRGPVAALVAAADTRGVRRVPQIRIEVP